MSDYIIRPATDAHRSFIFATWLRSYQANSLHAKRIPKALFFERHHGVIERILSRPGTETRIAAWSEDPEVILGYAVLEAPETVHFAYVKPAFRRSGLAAALLADVPRPFVYTHATYGLRDVEKHLDGCVYDPYAAVL